MKRIENLLDKFQDALFPLSGDTGLSDYVSYITQYAYILAAILMVLLVGTKVATYLANPTKEIDPYILVRPILILMALALYQPLVDFLLFNPTNIIIDITEDAAVHVTRTENKAEFLDIFHSAITKVPDSNEEGGGGLYEFLSMVGIFEVIHLLIYVIAALVTTYIMVRQLLQKALYFVLGILVLPLALIPGNEEILKKWFFGFLAILLWIPILRIVQTIMIIIHTIDTNSDGGSIIEVLFPVALQIVMIFFILNVPKYANLLVSGAGASDNSTIATQMYYNRPRGAAGRLKKGIGL